MDPLKMYFLLTMGIFHNYVSFFGSVHLSKTPSSHTPKTLPQAASHLRFFLGAYRPMTVKPKIGPKIPLTFFPQGPFFWKFTKKTNGSIQDLVSSLNSTCFHLKNRKFQWTSNYFFGVHRKLIIFFTEKTLRRKDLEIGSSGEGGNHFVPIGP